MTLNFRRPRRGIGEPAGAFLAVSEHVGAGVVCRRGVHQVVGCVGPLTGVYEVGGFRPRRAGPLR